MRVASRPRASMRTPANTNTTSATPPTVSPSRERDHKRFAEHETGEVPSREAERLQDRVLAGPLPDRHDDRVGEDQKDDPDDHDRDHLQRRDDRRRHLDETLLEFALTLGFRRRARVHELRVYRQRDTSLRWIRSS